MRYKIGELEVEAVQWNGDNKSEIIDTWPGLEEGISVNEDLWGRYTLSILWVNNRITYGDYIVKSRDGRFFVLDNQDFNKIATKVKEPKFKVGDKVYRTWPQVLVTNKVVAITRLGWYKLDSDSLHEESVLLTLEEAIEKLKEL